MFKNDEEMIKAIKKSCKFNGYGFNRLGKSEFYRIYSKRQTFFERIFKPILKEDIYFTIDERDGFPRFYKNFLKDRTENYYEMCENISKKLDFYILVDSNVNLFERNENEYDFRMYKNGVWRGGKYDIIINGVPVNGEKQCSK